MKKDSMLGGLVLVKQAPFGSLAIDCYTDGRGNFYMTRDQIGQALEYPHPPAGHRKDTQAAQKAA